MQQDWRVTLGQIAVDGLIAVGVLVLMALRPDFVAVGVALLGPLVGARAATVRQKAPEGAAVSAPASGALALLVAGGALLASMGLRAKGLALMAIVAVATLAGASACTATQRAQVLTIGANDCVLISDPVGRAMCVTADELLLLINQLTASSSSSSSVMASATVAGSATAPAAPPTQIRTPVTSIRLVAPLASSSSSSSR